MYLSVSERLRIIEDQLRRLQEEIHSQFSSLHPKERKVPTAPKINGVPATTSRVVTRTGQIKQGIYDMVARAPEGTITFGEIYEEVRKEGLSSAQNSGTVGSALNSLVAGGYVVRVGKGVYRVASPAPARHRDGGITRKPPISQRIYGRPTTAGPLPKKRGRKKSPFSLRSTILRTLRALDHPISGRELAKYIRWHCPQTIGQELWHLSQTGEVIRLGKGRYVNTL